MKSCPAAGCTGFPCGVMRKEGAFPTAHAHTLHRLQALGYKELFVPTQTTTWVAAKLYLDFGFRPVPENLEENYFGWRMLKTLTDHPGIKRAGTRRG